MVNDGDARASEGSSRVAASWTRLHHQESFGWVSEINLGLGEWISRPIRNLIGARNSAVLRLGFATTIATFEHFLRDEEDADLNCHSASFPPCVFLANRLSSSHQSRANLSDTSVQRRNPRVITRPSEPYVGLEEFCGKLGEAESCYISPIATHTRTKWRHLVVAEVLDPMSVKIGTSDASPVTRRPSQFHQYSAKAA